MELRFQFQQFPIVMFKFQIQFLEILIPIQILIPIPIPNHYANQTPPKKSNTLILMALPIGSNTHSIEILIISFFSAHD
ncbi:hypothetical protein HanPI659440_Chr09g0356021 [Helianthus annuus]|nr:hypothetical protein HanPI659440_Chr09g0356021 [Helianthus annuus]